ncbi:MAG: hypothetical protein QM723_22860 [Myxococcaceae bacterium]
MPARPAERRIHLIAVTAVVVVGLYDVIMLGPVTGELYRDLFGQFGVALPAPTQFLVDARWLLLGIAVVVHTAAAALYRRRFGLAICAVALIMSTLMTVFWLSAVHLAMFTVAATTR